MKRNTLPGMLVALVLLVDSSPAFAQLSDASRTTVFSDDVYRIGDPFPVTLCHIPPGNPANAHTMEVAHQAVPTHLAHGDLLGECPHECDRVPAPVAATGQTGCWDAYGYPAIDCAGTGEDGEYQYGVSADPRFTENGDGTVTDNLTGLIWLQDANCFGYRDWVSALYDANTLTDGSCGLTDGSLAGVSGDVFQTPVSGTTMRFVQSRKVSP